MTQNSRQKCFEESYLYLRFYMTLSHFVQRWLLVVIQVAECYQLATCPIKFKGSFIISTYDAKSDVSICTKIFVRGVNSRNQSANSGILQDKNVTPDSLNRLCPNSDQNKTSSCNTIA